MFKITLTDERILNYDPHQSLLKWENGDAIDLDRIKSGRAISNQVQVPAISALKPGAKIKQVQEVNISLGSKCNFGCGYCSQSEMKKSSKPETSAENIPHLIDEMTRHLEIDNDGENVLFYLLGGEPLAYWKKFKLLSESLHERFPRSQLQTTTNASLLDPEKTQFLIDHSFIVKISHDGPGQKFRGKDPLDNSEILECVRKLVDTLGDRGNVTFFCVLTEQYPSMKKVYEFLTAKLQRKYFRLSSSGVVSVYSQDAKNFAVQNQKKVWNQVFDDLTAKDENDVPHLTFNNYFHNNLKKIFDSLETERKSDTLWQKCNQDRPENISIDLNGSVYTCLNEASSEEHLIGHISDLAKVKLDTVSHFRNDENCMNCPVLQSCRGSCMKTKGLDREQTCDSHFAFHMGILAGAVYILTDQKIKNIQAPRIRRTGISQIEF